MSLLAWNDFKQTNKIISISPQNIYQDEKDFIKYLKNFSNDEKA